LFSSTTNQFLIGGAFPTELFRLRHLLFIVFMIVGAGSILLSFPTPTPFGVPRSTFIMWGSGCFVGAAVMVWLDRKRRGETKDEQTEQLLVDVLRRYRKTGSLHEIVEEYRASGVDDYTLSLVKTAPEKLKARADSKVQAGYRLFAFGVLCTGITYCLARTFGLSHYVVAIGALGVGSGLWLDGLRLRLAFRGVQKG
jgi:hypothetical protein